jgi:hypothetical protein
LALLGLALPETAIPIPAEDDEDDEAAPNDPTVPDENVGQQ